MRILSFNVNIGLAGDATTMDAIRDPEANVVFLQETTPAWEAVIRAELADAYPHMAFKHCCRAGGLAVLSKHPFDDAGYLPSPIGWFPGWRVVVDSPLGRVQILQVHLRPPISDSGSWVSGYFTTDAYRQREIASFVEDLEADLPTIVLGDFNEERGDAVGLLERRGMRDALREFDPNATTWHWPTRLGDITFALDHVLYGPRRVPLDADLRTAVGKNSSASRA